MNNSTVFTPKMRKDTTTVNIVFELKKDLQENEEICPNCRGTGLEISDNIYGISSDKTHVGVYFPYNKQAIKFCKYCYNGVLEKCEHCGSLKNPKIVQHVCKESKEAERIKQKQKVIGQWVNAKKIKFSELPENYGYVYIENFDEYIETEEEILEILDGYNFVFDDEPITIDDLRMYATTTVGLSIDAYSTIEMATEEYYEDSDEACDKEELQKLLDGWCEKQGIVTYYPDYTIGVIIK